jgi:hypothetical protein
MADMLQTGVTYLLAALSAHASRSVTYRRGATSATINATLGSTAFEEIASDGSVMRFESRDYIVSTPTISTALGSPQVGDYIDDGDIRYEVLPVTTQQSFKYLDPFRLGLRIHTKKYDDSIAG